MGYGKGTSEDEPQWGKASTIQTGTDDDIHKKRRNVADAPGSQYSTIREAHARLIAWIRTASCRKWWVIDYKASNVRGDVQPLNKLIKLIDRSSCPTT